MGIRVLVVDDSSLARNVLSRGLDQQPDIEVVATAANVYVARDRIIEYRPDVVTLDIEMEKMDGVEFVRRLIPQYPIPVVIVSALARPHAELTLKALDYGAVDFIAKPSARLGALLPAMLNELASKVRMAAKVDVRRMPSSAAPTSIGSGATESLSTSTDKIIVFGASTGGTVALERILMQMPAATPGTVVVQHMPPLFTTQFSERLNNLIPMEVKEAEDNERVLRGRVLVAPGDRHVTIMRSGGTYRVKCSDVEKVNGHRPSVSKLFGSVAENVGPNAIGVLLSGMGADGAEEMVAMRKAGARTFAQDEQSSVVFGMPKEAYERGGAEKLLPLCKIPEVLIRTIGEMR